MSQNINNPLSYQGDRPEIIRQVPKCNSILDVGCNQGSMGAALKGQGRAMYVMGLDYNSESIEKAKLLLNEYKVNKMTYLNIHWYEPAKEGDYPTPNIDNITNSDMKGFQETVEVLKQICNKPVITNEIGQFNTKGTLTTDILQKCYDLNLPYVIWYSGDGPKIGDAKALYNGSGILRESGTAFKNFIITKY